MAERLADAEKLTDAEEKKTFLAKYDDDDGVADAYGDVMSTFIASAEVQVATMKTVRRHSHLLPLVLCAQSVCRLSLVVCRLSFVAGRLSLVVLCAQRVCRLSFVA